MMKRIAMSVLILLVFVCMVSAQKKIMPSVCEGLTLRIFGTAEVKKEIRIEKKFLLSLNDLKWDNSFSVYEDGNLHAISSCAECMKAGESMPEGSNEYALYGFYRMDCLAFKQLLEAEPSDKSFVRDIKWDGSIAGLLPGSINPEAPDRDKVSLKDDDHVKFVKKGKLGDLILKGDICKYDLRRLAFGDFNHDGIEDMLIYYSDYPLESRDIPGNTTQKLYIITKLSKAGKLIIAKRID
jgi:hypothetical protein